MKNQALIIAALFALLSAGCHPQGGVENGADGSRDAVNLKKIASNFRSESDIVVEDSARDYMGEFDHRAFLDDLFEAIFAGHIVAYDFMDNPLSIEEVQYIRAHSDSTEVEDIETGKIDKVVIHEELNPDDVVKIFTSEDWYFDKEHFRIEKKVISMTLTTLKLDLNGDPIGYEILFKVYFDGREQS